MVRGWREIPAGRRIPHCSNRFAPRSKHDASLVLDLPFLIYEKSDRTIAVGGDVRFISI